MGVGVRAGNPCMGNLTFSGFQCQFSHPLISILSHINIPSQHRPCIVLQTKLLGTDQKFIQFGCPTLGCVVKIRTYVGFKRSNLELPAPAIPFSQKISPQWTVPLEFRPKETVFSCKWSSTAISLFEKSSATLGTLPWEQSYRAVELRFIADRKLQKATNMRALQLCTSTNHKSVLLANRIVVAPNIKQIPIMPDACTCDIRV